MTTFHVNGLVNVRHNEETKKILEEIENKSDFIRDRILDFAIRRGFKWQNSNGSTPQFMSDNKWNEYQELSNKSRRVDYTYIVAFHWLKSLEKYQLSNDAILQRLIILDKRS